MCACFFIIILNFLLFIYLFILHKGRLADQCDPFSLNVSHT